MFSFFTRLKSTSLQVLGIVLNIATLVYLISVFGFEHINKQFLINTFTGLSLTLVIITLTIAAISFVFYVSFKLAYKKILSNLDSITNIIKEEKH